MVKQFQKRFFKKIHIGSYVKTMLANGGQVVSGEDF